ncbi:helix-turn-helix domain-containing protein [Arthrobacter sp. I2-34]|uniref:Helix-turn-helix domain-containing protein n=1 Tax=Arthrobacter hankyongi TaxID=2904801 RepID=A0ABS9LDG0_9MICC|nr:IclR family transcriptional regulator C-terminal domain-containing protein [Arthrobacter hankyongi]MCG2624722.1 helix-turn-helix domain-containing protein [Arthrobacter hankyongi]
MSNSEGRRTSSESVLQVLWLLHRQPDVGVSDVAAALGVGQSTAHRLLSALVNEQMAVQTRQRRYQISPGYLRQFGGRVSVEHQADTIHSALELLAELTGETTHLMVLKYNNIQCLDSVESKQDLRVSSRKGNIWPAHRTASGRLLLRALSAEAFERAYPDGPPEDSGFGRDQLAEFRQSILQWREDYAFTLGGGETGITGIAMAIKDDRGRPMAAMAVNGPSVRIGRPQVTGIATTMRGVIDDLEARLRAS